MILFSSLFYQYSTSSLLSLASLKLFPTAIYPQQTNVQGIAAENHIKIVSCVDIF